MAMACAVGSEPDDGLIKVDEVQEPPYPPATALEVAGSQGDVDNHPPREVVPMLKEEALARGARPGMTDREPDPAEVDASHDKSEVMATLDRPRFGLDLAPIEASAAAAATAQMNSGDWIVLILDRDGDCAPDVGEEMIGTDPDDPDSDGDGWFDGPCNERRRLILETVQVYEDQEWWDDFYIVVDDVRYPNADMDDYWYANDGNSYHHNLLVAERVRGKDSWQPFQSVRVEGWEDDYETWNEWTVDDLLGSGDVDLGAYAHGQRVTLPIRHGGDCNDCWDYALTFRVEIDHFADPDPLHDSDSDSDGITDHNEWFVATYDGGIAHPNRKDVFIEVDAMAGHALHTNVKRLVTTQYHRHGYYMRIWRHEILPVDSCLTSAEARALYRSNFHREFFRAYRYAVIGEVNWKDASGVAINDTFLVDDSTWWVNGDVLAQSGTFIHELGHTMSLRNNRPDENGGKGYYEGIDTMDSPTYWSAMNYSLQALVVDYSDEGGWLDHDDWADVTPSWGLRYSFRYNPIDKHGPCSP